MGTFRFLLALLVALSHIRGSGLPGILGGSAVFGFYFLSGWLMKMSYERFSSRSPHPVRTFYLDRFVKIWPAYLVVLFVAVAFDLWSGMVHIEAGKVILDALLFPNAYASIIPGFSAILPYIPPTWSLGAEVHFYLLVPVLAILSFRTNVLITYFLVALHLLVLSSDVTFGDIFWCAAPLRDTLCTHEISDLLGAELWVLPTVFFLMGSVSYQWSKAPKTSFPHALVIWGAYAACFLFFARYLGWIGNRSAAMMLFSMSAYIPAAFVISYISMRTKMPKIDRLIGNLSYPMFLCHYPAIHVIQHFFGASHPAYPILVLSLAMIFSIIIALLQVFVFDHVRYTWRGFASAQNRVKAEN